jgi:hypothetical protein
MPGTTLTRKLLRISGVAFILTLLVLGVALGLSWMSDRSALAGETTPQVTFYLNGREVRRSAVDMPMPEIVPTDSVPFSFTAPGALTFTYPVTPVTPHYRISATAAAHVRLVISVPTQSRSENIDLFGWEDGGWRWQPSTVDATGRRREVVLTPPLPQALLAGRSAVPAPHVTAVMTETPSPSLRGPVRYWDVPAYVLSADGMLTPTMPVSDPLVSEVSGARVALVVRNYRSPERVNALLVREVLQDPVLRAQHLTTLLARLEDSGYAGLVLDYRGLPADLRDAYTRFVKVLADAVHDMPGQWLGVVVDFPTQMADGTWATQGYDWQRLGALVDQVRLVMPLPPEAYAPGDDVDAALSWAVTQVPRSNMAPIFVTRSTEGARTRPVSALLERWSTLQAGWGVTRVVAGQGVTLAPVDVTPHATDVPGATCFAQGVSRYCWGTPAWLQARYALAVRYGLGGVILSDLGAEGHLPGVTWPPAATSPSVRWRVTDPSGLVVEAAASLARPWLHWQAGAMPGVYQLTLEVAHRPIATTTLDVVPRTTATPAVFSARSVALSLPDPVYLEPGDAFTKTWRFTNVGAMAWPTDTVLQQLDSGGLAAPVSVTVGSVPPGQHVELALSMRAPGRPQHVVGRWALFSQEARIPGGDVLLVAQVGDPDAEVEPILQGPFELGGHIFQGLEHAEQMRYAGMRWVKIQARYGKDSVGQLITQAHAQGFKVLIGAVADAPLVTQPGFETRMAKWMAELAALGADAIEVWNEPNIPREWQTGYIRPAAYTRLLCTSYQAIKAANPNTLVISAAPAPTGYFGGCTRRGCDDLPWLESLYDSGAGNCLDYVGAHHNSGATSPSAISGHPADPGGTHHSWYFLPQTRHYFNIFEGTRQIFYTELGYLSAEGFSWLPDAFSWAQNTPLASQAQWLAEAAMLSKSSKMVRAMVIWNVDATCYGDCGGGEDPQAGFAIIRGGGVCPACERLHAVMDEP